MKISEEEANVLANLKKSLREEWLPGRVSDRRLSEVVTAVEQTATLQEFSERCREYRDSLTLDPRTEKLTPDDVQVSKWLKVALDTADDAPRHIRK